MGSILRRPVTWVKLAERLANSARLEKRCSFSYLRLLLMACTGDDGLKEFAWRNKGKKAATAGSVSAELKTNFRIYFPTKHTVVNSKGGRGVGSF